MFDHDTGEEERRQNETDSEDTLEEEMAEVIHSMDYDLDHGLYFTEMGDHGWNFLQFWCPQAVAQHKV